MSEHFMAAVADAMACCCTPNSFWYFFRCAGGTLPMPMVLVMSEQYPLTLTPKSMTHNHLLSFVLCGAWWGMLACFPEATIGLNGTSSPLLRASCCRNAAASLSVRNSLKFLRHCWSMLSASRHERLI